MLTGSGVALAANPPPPGSNLVRGGLEAVRNMSAIHARARISVHTKVILEPTQIALSRKNWQRDYNSTASGLSRRISDADVERAITEGGKATIIIFAKAFADGGYPVVTTPGPDVLTVRTAIINLRVTAPDKMTAGRSRTYASDPGSTGDIGIIEVRDSVSAHPGTRRSTAAWPLVITSTC